MVVDAPSEARSASSGAELPTGAAGARGRLPVWPLAVALVGTPVWWILGLSLFVWPVIAAVMVVYLLQRGRATAPAGFALWALFLAWMLLSGAMVDTGGRMAGFALRAAMYFAAGVVFLYVYNGSPRTLSFGRVSAMLTAVWVAVVAGGWFAIVDAGRTITTPMYRVLSSVSGTESILSNELVHKMLVVPLAQFNSQSYEYASARPAAPFPYTNTWGSAYAMLLPFVLLTVSRMRAGWAKAAMIAILVSSLVPAYYSQNRGMLLTLAVGLVYAGVRLGRAGHRRAFLATAGMLVTAALMAFVVPVGSMISERLQASSTNDSRLTLYREVLSRVAESPLFGYGAPRPSASPGLDSVGTQGQVWMVLFSHGFLGLLFFVGFFVWAVVATARTRGSVEALWGHTALLITLLQLPFYGVWSGNLMLFMVAAGLTVRHRRRDVAGGETPVPVGTGTGDVTPGYHPVLNPVR